MKTAGIKDQAPASGDDEYGTAIDHSLDRTAGGTPVPRYSWTMFILNVGILVVWVTIARCWILPSGFPVTEPHSPSGANVRSVASGQANLTMPETIRPVIVSWTPRIVAIDNFLSKEEAEYLLRKLIPKVPVWARTSLVSKDGTKVPKHTITSKIGSVPHTDPVIKSITERMATASLIPVEHMEHFHFLQYDPSDFFRGHLDAHALAGRPTSSRVATFFVYLNDVPREDGGETFFPLAVPVPDAVEQVPFVEPGRAPSMCERFARKDPEVQDAAERDMYIDGYDLIDQSELSSGIADRGLRFHPKQGAALIWWSRRPDGQIDPSSQHTGCPLRRGKKWTMVNWMHFQVGKKTQKCGDRPGWRRCMLHDYHVCHKPDNMTCTLFLDPFGQGKPRR